MTSTSLLRHGRPNERPAPISLKAGPLTLQFEPDTGWIRHIRAGDAEIVRAIYAAVRAADWSTVPGVISGLEVKSEPDAFVIRFEVEHREGDIHFRWHGEVTGNALGEVRYLFDGRAETSFLKNRVGICVLHPQAECAGKPCEVEHSDGAVETGAFPKLVSPHQPFFDVRAVRYEVAHGLKAEVRFAGEVFEMEDQRNWTDASFKTYSTPQELPKPARLEKGAVVRHEITLRLSDPQRKVLAVVQGRGAQLSIATQPVYAKPPLGALLPAEWPGELPVTRLRGLGLDHLRLDLKPAEPNAQERLARASTLAHALKVRLHLALYLTANAEAELRAVAEWVRSDAPPVSLWLIFNEQTAVTPVTDLSRAQEILAPVLPQALFAAGSDQGFVELNRNRLEKVNAFPCFPLTPQIHATDDLTMVENVAGAALDIETSRSFSPLPVVVSPVTLRPRENGRNNSDPRQQSLFGAGWTLALLGRLAITGHLHSLTLHELIGPGGYLPFPDSEETAAFPVYHVLADLVGFDRLCATPSTHPLQVEGLTLLNAKNQRRILVANLLGETQEIKIKTGSCLARVRVLDETSAGRAGAEPETFRVEAGDPVESVSGKIELRLAPYAIARVDIP